MKLKQIAEQLEGTLQGDPDLIINGVATLDSAGKGEISFFSNNKYKEQLLTTQADAVILSAEAADLYSGNRIVVSDPYLSFAQLLNTLHPERLPSPGVHATAFVAEDVEIPANVSVGPNACIMSGCKIGDFTQIGAGSYLGEQVSVGENCRINANVSLYPQVKLGDRVRLHSGSVIGADGFGYANQKGNWIKIPQVGSVRIGDDVEIGANTTVDRGALDDTVIERGVIIDNLVQIAHNVQIGAHTAIAGCVGIAGSTKIGKYCAIGGGVGIVGHIEIVDGTIVTAGSVVLQSILQAGTYSSGVPLDENKNWRRSMVHIKNLEKLNKKIKAMEKAGVKGE